MSKKMMEVIQAHRVETVDLKFTDLFGGWHHVTIPAGHLTEDFFSTGVGFDSSSVPGFKSIEAGDMVLLPDPESFFVDPFWRDPTLSILCNIVEADTRVQFSRDPRSIAFRAEQYLKHAGIASESVWGPEFEYHIFDEVRIANQPHRVYCEYMSEEAGWTPDGAKEAYAIPKFGGYHVVQPRDRYCDIRNETAKLLQNCGVHIHYHHHEVGSPGQSEIEVERYPLLKMADYAMMIKYFIRMVAHKYGKTVTFMPKPLYGDAGNGMHFHQHLFKDGIPLFYDSDGYAGLSKLAHHYIAGILCHAPALLAITNPSTNSYRRLVPGYEAPLYAFFSTANRTAAIRVPKYATAPMEKRIEFRPPDATCNIYMAMAAMLMAGIDGIEKEMDPRQMGFGPHDVNIFDIPTDKRPAVLPTSLNAAIRALEKDCEFLLKGEVFTSEILETWCKYKEKEQAAVDQRPHPYEIAMYYNT